VRSDEAHSFTTQERAMPREGRRPVRTYDAMARNVWIVARAHDVSDGTRRERAARDHADQTVGRNATGRDPPDNTADLAGPRIHARNHGETLPGILPSTDQLRDRENYSRALRATTRLYSEFATAH
jgi:hypothetical protein